MTEREERTYVAEQSKYMSIILHLPQLFESQIIQKYKIANFQNNLAYLACKYEDFQFFKTGFFSAPHKTCRSCCSSSKSRKYDDII